LSPHKRARPRPSPPSPDTPTRLGPTLSNMKLWPTVGSKLASHILSGLLRQGYTWGRGLCGPGERSSHCPLCPLKPRSAERARMSAKGHLWTLPGFILEVEIVPQRRKITVYHWLQSCHGMCRSHLIAAVMMPAAGVHSKIFDRVRVRGPARSIEHANSSSSL